MADYSKEWIDKISGMMKNLNVTCPPLGRSVASTIEVLPSSAHAALSFPCRDYLPSILALASAGLLAITPAQALAGMVSQTQEVRADAALIVAQNPQVASGFNCIYSGPIDQQLTTLMDQLIELDTLDPVRSTSLQITRYIHSTEACSERETRVEKGFFLINFPAGIATWPTSQSHAFQTQHPL